MKRTVLALASWLVGAGALGLGAGVLPGTAATAKADVQVSFGVFHDSLAPYGDWITIGRFGRVWRPSPAVVGVGFRPYATGGEWVYTDYGWSFESEWDWGWAPFHYGRWYLDPAYGWVWVPDTTWGPAWVDWRFGGGYVGWAPLPPYGVNVAFDAYSPHWCFVETPFFTRPHVWSYSVPFERVRYAYSVSAPIRSQITYGRARWYAGPPPTNIATAVGRPIAPVHVAPPRPGVVTPVRAASPSVIRAAPAFRGRAGTAAPTPRGNPAPAQPARPAPPATRVTPAQPARPAPPATRVTPAQPARPAPPATRVTPNAPARPMPTPPPTHLAPPPRVTPRATEPARPAPARPMTPAYRNVPRAAPMPARPTTPAYRPAPAPAQRPQRPAAPPARGNERERHER